MLSRVALSARCVAVVSSQARRHLGVTAALSQPDAIQQLFIDKIKDYAKQSKASGGKLVGATPDIEKTLAEQLDKLNRQYGANSPDFLKFPTFSFTDQPLEPPGVSVEVKDTGSAAAVEGEVPEEESKMMEEREYWQI